MTLKFMKEFLDMDIEFHTDSDVRDFAETHKGVKIDDIELVLGNLQAKQNYPKCFGCAHIKDRMSHFPSGACQNCSRYIHLTDNFSRDNSKTMKLFLKAIADLPDMKYFLGRGCEVDEYNNEHEDDMDYFLIIASSEEKAKDILYDELDNRYFKFAYDIYTNISKNTIKKYLKKLSNNLAIEISSEEANEIEELDTQS